MLRLVVALALCLNVLVSAELIYENGDRGALYRMYKNVGLTQDWVCASVPDLTNTVVIENGYDICNNDNLVAVEASKNSIMVVKAGNIPCQVVDFYKNAVDVYSPVAIIVLQMGTELGNTFNHVTNRDKLFLGSTQLLQMPEMDAKFEPGTRALFYQCDTSTWDYDSFAWYVFRIFFGCGFLYTSLLCLRALRRTLHRIHKLRKAARGSINGALMLPLVALFFFINFVTCLALGIIVFLGYMFSDSIMTKFTQIMVMPMFNGIGLFSTIVVSLYMYDLSHPFRSQLGIKRYYFTLTVAFIICATADAYTQYLMATGQDAMYMMMVNNSICAAGNLACMILNIYTTEMLLRNVRKMLKQRVLRDSKMLPIPVPVSSNTSRFSIRKKKNKTEKKSNTVTESAVRHIVTSFFLRLASFNLLLQAIVAIIVLLYMMPLMNSYSLNLALAYMMAIPRLGYIYFEVKSLIPKKSKDMRSFFYRFVFYLYGASDLHKQLMSANTSKRSELSSKGTPSKAVESKEGSRVSELSKGSVILQDIESREGSRASHFSEASKGNLIMDQEKV